MHLPSHFRLGDYGRERWYYGKTSHFGDEGVIRAVLFDLDDTLYDRFPAIRTYARSYFIRDFGNRMEPLDVEMLAEMVVGADGGPQRTGKEAMRELQRRLPWKPGQVPSWRQLLEHWLEFFPYCSQWTQEMEDVVTSLKQHGLKLAVVTNGPSLGQNRKIDALGIRPCLDAVVISGSFGVRKPEPAIFLEALARLEIAAPDAWFVGDNPVADIGGAMAVGMETVWLRRYGRPWRGASLGPGHTVTDIREVLPLVLSGPNP